MNRISAPIRFSGHQNPTRVEKAATLARLERRQPASGFRLLFLELRQTRFLERDGLKKMVAQQRRPRLPHLGFRPREVRAPRSMVRPRGFADS